jgi:hypothetical protein
MTPAECWNMSRGPGRFRFSYKDIADVCGRTLNTVRSDLRLSSSVESIAAYVIGGLIRRSTRLSDQQVASALGCSLEQWQARWPRFVICRCGWPGCDQLLLEPSVCRTHGGSLDPFAVVEDNHVKLRVGSSYVPICHIVFGAPRDLQVTHRDGNDWNNRPDNLEVVGDPKPDRRRRWTYDYAALGQFFKLSEESVRQAVSRGQLDPTSFEEICSFRALIDQRR